MREHEDRFHEISLHEKAAARRIDFTRACRCADETIIDRIAGACRHRGRENGLQLLAEGLECAFGRFETDIGTSRAQIMIKLPLDTGREMSGREAFEPAQIETLRRRRPIC